MVLLIFEKITLTDGMMVGGRNPATTIAMVAAMSAYSMRSWPFRLFHRH